MLSYYSIHHLNHKNIKISLTKIQTDSTANQPLPALEVGPNQNQSFRQYGTFGNLRCRVKHQHLNSLLIITTWTYKANVVSILHPCCVESMAKFSLTLAGARIIFRLESTEIITHLCLFWFK